MKVSYIVALLMIVIIVGCATTQPEAPAAPAAAPPTEAPTAPPTEAPPAPPTEEAEEAAPVVVEGDILVTSAGFDPAEMTVTVGSALAIKSAEGRHKLTVDGTTTPIIEEGTAYEVTFDKVGNVRIFDIFTKKSAYVTVTEEAVEEEAVEEVEEATE